MKLERTSQCRTDGKDQVDSSLNERIINSKVFGSQRTRESVSLEIEGL